MAVLWDKSRTYERDDSGDPVQGALAYFFDTGTTTPMVVYTDAAFSTPHDHPVPADAFGKWPAVFLPAGATYRLRITTAAGGTISDDDGISVPTTEPPEFPDSDTDPEFLFQTGDLKFAYRTSAPTGWVRANGRTLGAAASGATERANADAEDLFIHLWEEDATLAVSGGRGGTSAGDWAANKTIALPDLRGRALIGMDSMGNSAAGRVTDAQLGEDSDGLGSVGGAADHALIEAELAAHDHVVNITDPGHRHFEFANAVGSGGLTNTTQVGSSRESGGGAGDYTMVSSATEATLGRSSSATTGITADAEDAGSGTAHNNMQPSMVAIALIKL